MAQGQLGTYSVNAFNVSHASENKIHDDTVAKKLGFTGGLVPGVEVFGYASHMAVEKWGRAWLERGTMACRFLKPVYDGRTAEVTAVDNGGSLEIRVDSDGVHCATATATLPAGAGAAPALTDYRTAPQPRPEQRPNASPESLRVGTWLTATPLALTEQASRDYLRDVRETNRLYATDGLAHPGQILRLCNSALKDNVLLPPWIHTGSKLTNFGVGRIGDVLSARARVADNYERKGHRLVDLDVVITANDQRIIAHVLHTAVYQLRHLQGA